MTKQFKIEQYTVASYSTLKGLDPRHGAPNKVKHSKEAGRSEDTAAQRYGKALDTAILKPDLFHKRFKTFTTIPKTDTVKYSFVNWFLYATYRNKSRETALRFAKKKSGIRLKLDTLDSKTNLGSEYSPEIEWIIQSKSFVPLTFEEYDSVMWASEAARNYEPFEPYLGDPEIEIQAQIEWTNPATGVKCKGEPDLFKRGHWVGDIKSTNNAAPAMFAGKYGDVRRYHYGEQVYAYGEGLDESMETPRLIFAIEKQAPYACSLIRIGYDDLLHCRDNFSMWCATFKHIRENNLWDMGYEYFSLYEPAMEMNLDTGQPMAMVREKGFDGIFETEIFSW